MKKIKADNYCVYIYSDYFFFQEVDGDAVLWEDYTTSPAELRGWMINAAERDVIPFWDSVVNLMDDEIREELHREGGRLIPHFFYEYKRRHFKKYQEDFVF